MQYQNQQPQMMPNGGYQGGSGTPPQEFIPQQGTPIAGGQGPIPAPQGSPQYLQEQSQPEYVIRPPEPSNASFVPDSDTKKILDSIHPELLNAAINIAIKKFSATDEFVGFYVREEARAQAEANQESINEVAKEKQVAKKEQSAPQKQSMDFSSW